jgi:inosose dehydratase
MNIQGVATQMFVWGQVYGKAGKSVDENLDEIFGYISQSGYDGVEGGLNWTSDQNRTEQLRQLLDKHSLRLPSLYHGGVYHKRDEAEKTIENTMKLAKLASKIGCPAVNVNPAPIGREKTDDELKIQGDYLNRMGAALQEIGMSFYIHNHTPEIINDARELRADCEYTDPELVGLCLDTHWVYRGGVDPMSLMREYPDRIKSLHIRNSKDGVWMESFGEGDIDHAEMKEVLQNIGYDSWLIVELAYEQDTKLTRSLPENSKLSREYVKQVFGV